MITPHGIQRVEGGVYETGGDGSEGKGRGSGQERSGRMLCYLFLGLLFRLADEFENVCELAWLFGRDCVCEGGPCCVCKGGLCEGQGPILCTVLGGNWLLMSYHCEL